MERSIEIYVVINSWGSIQKSCVLKDMKYTVIDAIKGFKNSFTINIKSP